MRFLKWIVSAIFTFSLCNSCLLFAQEKRSTKPAVKARPKAAAKPKTGSPLDSVIDTLNAAHPFEQTAIAPNGKKVAGVGSGPAGHSAAYQLTRLGYEVTILEKWSQVSPPTTLRSLSKGYERL